jgi:hypothetical protein
MSATRGYRRLRTHGPVVEGQCLAADGNQSGCRDDGVGEVAGVFLADGKGARDDLAVLDDDRSSAFAPRGCVCDRFVHFLEGERPPGTAR